MPRLPQEIAEMVGAQPDEEAWEGFTDDEVILQRPCMYCEHGLLLAPARFCTGCGGSGYVTRTVKLLEKT